MSAINLIQTTKSGSASSTNPLTLAFTSNITAGSLLIVGAVYATTPATQLGTPSGNSNTYNSLFAVAGTGVSMQIWYVLNANSGATTVSIPNTNGWGTSIFLREYSGIGSLDTTLSATGSSLNPSSGAIFPGVSNQLIIGAFVDNFGTGQTYTVGTGYSNLSSIINGTSFNIAMEDKIMGQSISQTATATLGSSAAWVAAIACFRGTYPSFKPNPLRPHPFSPGIAR